jgi:hypothetical protein
MAGQSTVTALLVGEMFGKAYLRAASMQTALRSCFSFH